MNITDRPTPETNRRIQEVSIDCDDSCCGVYVTINGVTSGCDLVDADFARRLEQQRDAAVQALEDILRLAYLSKKNEDAHFNINDLRTNADIVIAAIKEKNE